MRNFVRRVQSQIAKVRAAGGLTGRKSEGKLPPDQLIETGDQAALSTDVHVVAYAGMLPKEFMIKRDLDAARQVFTSLKTEEARALKMSEISSLELRYNEAVEARRSFPR